MSKTVLLTLAMATVLLHPALFDAGPLGPATGALPPSSQDTSDRSEPNGTNQTNLGIRLSMSPEEMFRIMYFHLRETRTANITLTNNGTNQDTAILKYSIRCGSGNPNWTLKYGCATVALGPNETRSIGITVSGPPSGHSNDYADILLTATSNNTQQNSTIGLRAYLIFDTRLSISCPDRVHATGWCPTSYQIQLSNGCDATEIVYLSAAGPPGWNVTLEFEKVTLEPASNLTFSVGVLPPWDAQCDEVGMVTITARCACGANIGSVVLYTIACMCPQFEIWCEQPENYVSPGESVSFELAVSNVGNMAGQLQVQLAACATTGQWPFELDRHVVHVGGMETEFVNVTLHCPKDTKVGERMVVRALGRVEGTPFYDDVTITAMAKQVHNLCIAVHPENIEAEPGAASTFMVRVFNRGNGPETITLRTVSSSDTQSVAYWNDSSEHYQGESPELSVPFSEWVDIGGLLTIAPGAGCGDYSFRINVTDGNGCNQTLEPSVRVRQNYAISMTPDRSVAAGYPGDVLDLTLTLVNNGNGPDAVQLGSCELPPGFSVAFLDPELGAARSIGLEAGASRDVRVRFTVPENGPAGNWTIVLTGRSLGGLTQQVDLTARVLPAAMDGNLPPPPPPPTPHTDIRPDTQLSDLPDAVLTGLGILMLILASAPFFRANKKGTRTEAEQSRR